ncbi:MAG: diguanylate cyclase [Gallionella sp.]|nr:diguanylate cyclase [Gallionella sp.]
MEATRAMGIHGFVVPADYTPVADLLKELRMPPFDQAPSFILHDVWERYLWQLISILLATTVVLMLGVRLALVKRKLEQQHKLLLEQKRALQESEVHLQTVIQNEPECIKIIDASGRLRQINPAGLAMIEADAPDQVVGRPVLDLIAPEYREAFAAMHKRVLAGESVKMVFEVLGLKGGRRWLETHAVPMREQGELVHLAVTRDVTERKQMEDQIRQLAFYDPLTQLPNRRLLNDRMEQEMSLVRRHRRCGVLMVLDLDNFKPLNDTYGHSAGDKLLIEVAQRLGRCVRETDTVSRFGGDEFVVMLTELDTDAAGAKLEAGLVAKKIRDVLAVPYWIDLEQEEGEGHRIQHTCTASIGVVIFDQQAQQEEIFRRADMAMYDAKRMGRNRIVIVDSQGMQGSGSQQVAQLRLVWLDSYKSGEATIDGEHRRLFELANALIEAAFDRDENQAGFEVLLDQMLSHMERHFADEERILRQHSYSDLEDHIRAHRLLLEHALSLRERLLAGGVTTGELVNFIADEVVTQHMLRTDRLFYSLFKVGQD